MDASYPVATTLPVTGGETTNLWLMATLGAVPTLAAPPGPTIVEVAIAVNSDGPFAGEFDTLIAAANVGDPDQGF